jgi:hypothetical protein
MAITSAICSNFKKDILSGIHAAADTYKIALYVIGATMDQNTTVYSNANELATANNYTQGGQNLTGFNVQLLGAASNIACLTFANAVWAGANFTAAGCMIYNSNKSNNAVAVFSFGGNITATNANFTVVMPTQDQNNSLIRLT